MAERRRKAKPGDAKNGANADAVDGAAREDERALLHGEASDEQPAPRARLRRAAQPPTESAPSDEERAAVAPRARKPTPWPTGSWGFPPVRKSPVS